MMKKQLTPSEAQINIGQLNLFLKILHYIIFPLHDLHVRISLHKLLYVNKVNLYYIYLHSILLYDM